MIDQATNIMQAAFETAAPVDDINQNEPIIHQSQLPKAVIKQRHIGEGVPFLWSGLSSKRPTSGQSPPLGSSVYYSTDTHLLNLWNGKTWDQYQYVSSGVASSRPTAGTFVGQQYMSSDTHVFSVWDGATWRTVTLT